MAVRIFSTPSCVHCRHLKSYLRDRDVRFTEYDVSRDEHKAQEMYAKSRQHGVPVLDFNGTIVVGFDRAKVDRLIGGGH